MFFVDGIPPFLGKLFALLTLLKKRRSRSWVTLALSVAGWAMPVASRDEHSVRRIDFIDGLRRMGSRSEAGGSWMS